MRLPHRPITPSVLCHVYVLSSPFPEPDTLPSWTFAPYLPVSWLHGCELFLTRYHILHSPANETNRNTSKLCLSSIQGIGSQSPQDAHASKYHRAKPHDHRFQKGPHDTFPCLVAPRLLNQSRQNIQVIAVTTPAQKGSIFSEYWQVVSMRGPRPL